MPRRPKHPDKKHKFRLHVVLDGALIAAIDLLAAQRNGAYSEGVTRSDTVREALSEYVVRWTDPLKARKETP